MSRTASEETWAAVRAAWEAGASYRAASEAVENGPSRASISRRALSEGWARSLAPGLEPVAAGAPTAEIVDHSARATAILTAQTGLKLAQRRGELIDGLFEDALELRGQFFAPVIRKEVKVVSGGKDLGQDVEIVEVELPRMPPNLQKDTALALAIIVDKMLLLAGEATGRTETITPDRDAVVSRVQQLRDELGERRKAAGLQAETG